MTTINLQTIREELCLFLRNSDVLSVSVRGVTTITNESFTATAGQTVFTLAHALVRNVRSITVQAVNKYYLTDYTVNFTTGVVTLGVGATVGNTVLVTYDYGTSDKIYPDFPRDDLTFQSYPRVGIELTSISTEPIGLGGMNHLSDLLITIIAIVSANKDVGVAGGFGGLSDLESLWKNVRTSFRTGAKGFVSFPYITPSGTGPIFKGKSDKLLQQTFDFRIRWVLE